MNWLLPALQKFNTSCFTVMINNSRFGKVYIIGQLVGLVYPETIVILTISSNHLTAFVDMQPAATAGNKCQPIPNEYFTAGRRACRNVQLTEQPFFPHTHLGSDVSYFVFQLVLSKWECLKIGGPQTHLFLAKKERFGAPSYGTPILRHSHMELWLNYG